MEEQFWLIVILTKWSMVATGLASWSLKFIIPNPTKVAKIFELDEAPKAYAILYNIIRYIAGNDAFGTRAKLESTVQQKTTVDAEGAVKTKTLITEKTTPTEGDK